MRQSLEQLCGLLEEQKGVLESMLELSLEERQIIICGDADRLDGIVRQKHRGVSKLGALEKKRMAILPDVERDLRLPQGGGTTVSLVAKRAEPGEREVIGKLQEELTALLKRHTALNKENHELIKSHFDYADAMLNLMVDPEDPLNNFYGGDGKAAPERKRTTGFFDGQA